MQRWPGDKHSVYYEFKKFLSRKKVEDQKSMNYSNKKGVEAEEEDGGRAV